MNVYIYLAASAVLCGVELAQTSRSDSVASLRPDAAQHTHDFVEVIKKDLKRNNDDYKDLSTQSKFTPTIKTLDVTFKTLPLVFDDNIINGKNNAKTFRRSKDRSNQYYQLLNEETANNYKVKDNKATPKIVTNITPRLRNLSHKFNVMPSVHNQSMIENLHKVMSARKSSLDVMQSIQHKYRPSAASKLINEKKINKFKQFVDRNKKLFKEYLSSKVNVPTSKAQPRQFHMNETEQNKLKQHDKEIKSKIWSEEDVGELPDAAVLDMAPGKGGRIHRQRIKGRLCHRHVLLPEGPKYDAAGRWYLPPRPPRPPRAPALLLPRCCNCCKKSVLGCE